MVERSTNTINLNHTADTLISLIQRHVMPGSTRYLDGWSTYIDLNALWYRQFTVIHNYSFKKTYKHAVTRERVTLYTNRMEVKKHAKDHLKCLALNIPN